MRYKKLKLTCCLDFILIFYNKKILLEFVFEKKLLTENKNFIESFFLFYEEICLKNCFFLNDFFIKKILKKICVGNFFKESFFLFSFFNKFFS